MLPDNRPRLLRLALRAHSREPNPLHPPRGVFFDKFNLMPLLECV